MIVLDFGNLAGAEIPSKVPLAGSSPKGVYLLAAQAVYAFLSGQQHAPAGLAKGGQVFHAGSNLGCNFGHGVADRLQHHRLRFGRDAEGRCNEARERFARSPGLFAKKADPRRIVLIAR
jgi:hypothetical protein